MMSEDAILANDLYAHNATPFQAQAAWLIWFIWFIWSIWLVWFNQINKTDQTDRTDQMKETGWRTFSASC